MKVFCISQARMGSTRLPGKVLKEIAGIPLLQYHVLRVAQSSQIHQHIVATTTLEQDQVLVNFCEQRNIAYFRGDENNVLSRYYQAAKAYNAQPHDLIIRVTSDCPLIDAKLIDTLVQQHVRQNMQGISNIDISSYPRGFDAEVFTMEALTNAYINAQTPFQLEHVTPYLYQHKDIYPPQSLALLDYNFIKNTNLSPADLRLCVDELADFQVIAEIIKGFANDSLEKVLQASAENIINFLYQHPEIAQMNQHIQQKSH